MSLTSYRAAPPRGMAIVERAIGAFVRSGGDLLSRVLGRSTIGAAALNGRVRDGIGCFARAMATRPGKKRSALPLCRGVLSKLMLREKNRRSVFFRIKSSQSSH